MRQFDKAALVAELKERLAAEVARHTRRARDAAEAATHEENRPEGDKDMRSTEASYIARGQADRAREVEQAWARLSSMPVRDFAAADKIAASALVEVEQGDRVTTYLLVTAAGGERLGGEDEGVLTLAVTSPLGGALIGLTAGEEAEVSTAQGTRLVTVLGVR